MKKGFPKSLLQLRYMKNSSLGKAEKPSKSIIFVRNRMNVSQQQKVRRMKTDPHPILHQMVDRRGSILSSFEKVFITYFLDYCSFTA